VDILFLLIPLGLVLLGVAIWGFLWAVRSGQFDDLEGPAHRILMDDDDPRIPRTGQPDEEKQEKTPQDDA
jgi:cbb3-type cytochrome oxidase maturation protein